MPRDMVDELPTLDEDWATNFARQRYLAALRSGTYRKSEGSLREPDGSLCALGLAYKLFGAWELPGGSEPVHDLLGVDADLHRRIIEWNDRHQLSFAEIAGRLEAMWRLHSSGSG